jgi:hypothetical protein
MAETPALFTRASIEPKACLTLQDSVDSVGEIPADLAHSQPVCDGRHACDLHLARRQLDEEQHHESLQPFSWTVSMGHFYFAQIGHYHFAPTLE